MPRSGEGKSGVAPDAAAGIEAVAEQIEEPEGFGARFGETAGAEKRNGGAGEKIGVGAVVVAMEKHEVFASVQAAQEGAGVAQAMEKSGFVEGVVGHQEDVASGGDVGTFEQSGQGFEFKGGDASAGVPEVEVGTGGIQGDGDRVVAHPSEERIAGGRGVSGQVRADEGGEILAVMDERSGGVEVVVAGDGEGATAGEGQSLGQARGGGGVFALKAEIERVAGEQDVVHRFAPEEFVQAMEFLVGVGILGASAQGKIKRGDDPFGMESFRGAKRPVWHGQVKVAEMEDPQAHGGGV